MSNESDKTRMQFSSADFAADTQEAETNEADKTRFLAPGDNIKNTAADKPIVGESSAEKQNPNKSQAAEKARQLEKRLAAIAAAKKSKQQESADTSEAPLAPPTEADATVMKPSDKTVFKPRIDAQADNTPHDSAEQNNNNSPDKTQFKPGIGAHSALDAKPNDGSSDVPSSMDEHADAGSEDTLKGRFVYEKILGAGGMGVVYKAKDLLKVEAQDRDPYVAIKVLGDEFKAHPEAFIALQRESRKTQRIAHPNIVNVHDFDRDGDTVFMTMEFLDGRPLDQFISQYKATGLPEDEAYKILEGISSALVYAHEQKIIHSDFKPGNIFVTNQGLAKVFDFGIARAVAKAEKFEESTDDKTVFDAGNLGALTPAYASLEMLEGEVPDVRDDIYALGCIAYEMYTGNHPFNRVHANEAMRKKMKPKRIANLSKRQWRAIEKALAFKREDRTESVEEFWRSFTSKRGAGIWIGVGTLFFVSVITVLAYQIYFAPKEEGFSEDEIRSEIERKVIIDQNKNSIEQLIASPEFDKAWEKNLYQSYDILTKLLSKEDVWLVDNTRAIADLYLAQINSLVEQQNYPRAREVLENMPRYGADEAQIAELMNAIESGERRAKQEAQAAEKRKADAVKKKQIAAEQTKIQSEKDIAFDVAMDTVDKQLQCRSTMNMRDIDVAVSKLKSLNAVRFRKVESEIVAKLSVCISKIGRSFPERAHEFKKRALRIFPGNETVALIKIVPKDPCDTSLAGLGARGNRAMCRDPLKDDAADLGRGPALVVIPAKGSMEAFAIGKYEITVDEMNRYCENSKACEPDTSAQGKNPVTNISASQIKKYLQWLSVKSKRKYRLPSKSEWVYAARANSNKMDSNRNCRLESRGIKKGGTLIKASTGQQNPWGLINTLGNARELVSKGGRYQAMGGSYDNVIEECVVTFAETHSGEADATSGFRALREIAAK